MKKKAILLNIDSGFKEYVKKGAVIKDMTISAFVRYAVKKELVRLGVIPGN